MQSLYNTLRMLMILSENSIVKTEVLSEVLEVSPRQIRRYKRDLEDVGIEIESLTGKNGGMKLINSDVEFNNDENFYHQLSIGLIKKNLGQLKSKNVDVLRQIIDIISNKNINPLDSELIKLMNCKVAIEKKRKIKIEYTSPYISTVFRTVSPYFILEKFNRYYLIGYDHQKDRETTYRISRIDNLVELDEQFFIDENELERIKEKYDSSFGMYTGKPTSIKLKINYPNAITFKEDFKDIEFKIIEDNGEWMIVELTVCGLIEIKKYILKEGRTITVIEPYELKELIKEEIQEMKKNYE